MIYSQKSGIIYTRNSERNSDELPRRTANIFLSAVKLSGGRGMKQRTYIAIDLKSFYASVECMERKLDPMTTNLVVSFIVRELFRMQHQLSFYAMHFLCDSARIG